MIGHTHMPFFGEHTILIKGIESTKKLSEKITEDYSYIEFHPEAIISGVRLVGTAVFSENLKPIDGDNRDINGKFISKKELIQSDFMVEGSNFDDLLFELTIPKFTLPGMEDIAIQADLLVLDLSDQNSSKKIKFPSNYRHPLAKTPNWMGFYLQNAVLQLPPYFAAKGTKTWLRAKYLLYDDSGFSGDFEGKNLVDIKNGEWGKNFSFGLDYASIQILQNRITGGAVSGRLKTSLDQKNEFSFEGIIKPNAETNELDYELTVGGLPEMNLDMFRAKVKVYPESKFSVVYEKGIFKPSVDLSGELALDSDGLLIKKVYFQNLKLSLNELSLGGFRAETNGDLDGLPLEINSIDASIKGRWAKLILGVQVNIGNNFSGATTIQVSGLKVNEGKSWKLREVKINAIYIAADMGAVSFSGQIVRTENDPVYGNVFAGAVELSVKEMFTISASAAFGSKDGMDYWFMDVMAEFGEASPIAFPPVTVTGMGGALAYRMRADGTSEGNSLVETPSGTHYIPNKNKGLFLRFMVNFGLTGSSSVLSGKGSFEMSFNKNMGLEYIAIYGMAEMMTIPPSVSKDQLGGDLVALNNATSGKDNSEIIKNDPTKAAAELPFKSTAQTGIRGNIGFKYDLRTKTLNGNLDAELSTQADMIKGKVTVSLMVSPKGWYFMVGHPDYDRRARLTIGLGGRGIGVHAYFMIGTLIPDIPNPPPHILKMLQKAEVTYTPTSLASDHIGSGIGFGLGFEFDTGDIQVGFIFGRVQGSFGFDMLLKQYEGFGCQGGTNQVGINGWYAMGQVYASLEMKVGVKIDTFLFSGRYVVLEGGAGLLLQGSGPNPWWFKGTLVGYYNLFGGAVSGKFAFEVEMGQKCELKRTESKLARMEIIADTSPQNDQKGVDVFSNPTVVLNLKNDEEFELEVPNSGKGLFRMHTESITLKNKTGEEIPTEIVWNSSQEIANVVSNEILPGNETLTLTAVVSFQKQTNGNWTVYTEKGKELKETKEIKFTTGPAPDYISQRNLAYTYPLPDMAYFYPKESNEGYVQLKQGQSYLFQDKNSLRMVLVDENEQKVEANFTYNKGQKRISYQFPSGIKNESYYTFALVKKRTAQGSNIQIKESQQTTQQGQSEMQIRQREALGSAISNDDQIILSFDLYTSKFNTFGEKMATLQLTGNTFEMVAGPYTRGLLQFSKTAEPFSPQELYGSKFSLNKPLIYGEATLQDKYYKQNIAPLLYENPVNQNALTNILAIPENKVVGVPPTKTLKSLTGYVEDQYSLPLIDYTHHYYYSQLEDVQVILGNKLFEGGNLSLEQQKVYDTYIGGLPPKGTEIETAIYYSLPGKDKSHRKPVLMTYKY